MVQRVKSGWPTIKILHIMTESPTTIVHRTVHIALQDSVGTVIKIGGKFRYRTMDRRVLLGVVLDQTALHLDVPVRQMGVKKCLQS